MYGRDFQSNGDNAESRNENIGHPAYKRENLYGDEHEETPKWQPDPERYNTTSNSNKQKKQSRRWVVPLVIVLAAMVAVIVIAATVGSRYLNNLINRTDAAVVEDVQSEVEADAGVRENNVVWSEVSDDEDSVSGVVMTDVTKVVEDVYPAVVSITSRTIINNSDYFNFFFGYDANPYGDENGGQQEVESGLGSGTIIGQDDDGLLILTSNHVVEDSSSLAVTFVNGTSVDGVIKSASEDTDIAIVSVPLDDIDDETMDAIKTAKLSTRQAQVGEGVVVIGNPLGYGMSVTTGIVSAVDRQLSIEGKNLSVIQTDAAINSGNSGGCMLNSKGEIIGISEAKITISSVEGMCYAIPISGNMELIQSLLDEETPEIATGEDGEQPTGAYLGIRGRDITSDLADAYDMPQGVYVSAVVEGSGADAAGLEDGDIIVALDGEDTTTMAKLQFELSKHNAKDTVLVTVMRGSQGKYQKADLEVELTGLTG